ncbi:DoxX family protein [Streptomyces sp. XD-27]|uniref:DoxX family protein n=1 Tax=Streptomyces sp. XD-27 TaxID=3062779 RepID=UPI0026F42AD0|nr:DoxX family protein [Streptomyces sp. XD-27]WKX71906.1 DoxX family protein [Streptomyces sp. XD-27]
MFTAYVVVTVLAAAANGYSASNHFTRPQWILDTMTSYNVPLTWLPPLGVLKAAGVLGLLVGLRVTAIAVAASVGLILYYVGAMAAILRSRRYAHLPAPVPFLLLVAGSLTLRLASS